MNYFLFLPPMSFCSATAELTISTIAKYASCANAGWINFRPNASNGVVLSEYSLASCTYAANVGWMHFGWGDLNDVNAPHVNLLTGQFKGFAYSSNPGWISLDTSRSTLDG